MPQKCLKQRLSSSYLTNDVLKSVIFDDFGVLSQNGGTYLYPLFEYMHIYTYTPRNPNRYLVYTVIP